MFATLTRAAGVFFVFLTCPFEERHVFVIFYVLVNICSILVNIRTYPPVTEAASCELRAALRARQCCSKVRHTGNGIGNIYVYMRLFYADRILQINIYTHICTPSTHVVIANRVYIYYIYISINDTTPALD